MKRIYFILCFLVSFAVLNAQTVNLVRIEKLSEQIVGESVVKKIFENSGIPLTIEEYPGLRCNQLALAGEKDGEMMRIFNYGVKNPTLIRVPTPYYNLETTVFIKKGSNVVVTKKEDLAKYKIVIVRGVQHTADITEGLPNVNVVDTTEQMMKFLQVGRVDLALANRIDGLASLKMAKIDDIVAGETLAKNDLYIYIHPNKKNVVEKIDQAIKKIKSTGELDKLVKESETKYLNSIR